MENNDLTKQPHNTLWDKTRAEPYLEFYDNVITQMDLESFDIKKLKAQDIEALCEDILAQLQETDNKYKKFTKVHFPCTIIMDHQSYPMPFHAGDGLVVTAMFSKYWNKTWGGEIITYHDTEPEDIVSAFPGRIYVSHGTPWNRIQQPNIKADIELQFVQFRLAN
jgi:hypothetical protein